MEFVDDAIPLTLGLAARLSDEDRRCFRDFFLALGSNNATACATAIVRAALAVPNDFDQSCFQRDVAVLVRAYYGRNAGNFLIAEFVYRVFELQRRHGLFGTPGFAAAIWALVMYEGLVRMRYPHLDFPRCRPPICYDSNAGGRAADELIEDRVGMVSWRE